MKSYCCVFFCRALLCACCVLVVNLMLEQKHSICAVTVLWNSSCAFVNYSTHLTYPKRFFACLFGSLLHVFALLVFFLYSYLFSYHLSKFCICCVLLPAGLHWPIVCRRFAFHHQHCVSPVPCSTAAEDDWLQLKGIGIQLCRHCWWGWGVTAGVLKCFLLIVILLVLPPHSQSSIGFPSMPQCVVGLSLTFTLYIFIGQCWCCRMRMTTGTQEPTTLHMMFVRFFSIVPAQLVSPESDKIFVSSRELCCLLEHQPDVSLPPPSELEFVVVFACQSV